MEILINPLVKWAVVSGEQDKMLFIDNMHNATHKLPEVNDVISRPFIVDPITKKPIKVRVAEIQKHYQLHGHNGHTLVVVVSLAHEIH